MKLIALEIPDEPAELPAWLEGQLLGFDLAALVAELEAIHGDPGAKALPMDRILGSDRAAVLQRGLSALPRDRLREFLRHPGRLLDLQELVLVEGGPYWQRLAPKTRESARIDAEGWRRLDAFLTGDATPAPRVHTPRTTARRHPWRWVAILASASSLLVAVLIYQRSPEPATSIAASDHWGWLRPDAFPQQMAPAEYLTQLAQEAEEWFNRRPDDRKALARRIAEFRQGCSTLILAEHCPLSPQDRQWLVRTCRQWASDLNKSLEDVENCVNPLLVREKVDQSARQIAKQLRDRAQARA
jgi:hypothetical protein